MTLGVGIDVGYGHTKALSSAGACAVFPSAVGVADPQAFRLQVNGRAAPRAQEPLVCLDGVSYLVGESARRHARTVVQPRDRAWLDSLPYRILWHAALEHVVPAEMTISIVTGLPVSFYHDRERLQQVIRQVLAQRQITASAVHVVPQPFGSFFDAVLDPQGTIIDESRILAHLGLIDVGYFTTDLVEVQELEYVQKGSGSIEVGVATMIDTLRAVVTEQYGRALSPHEVEQVLRTAHVRLAGREHNVQELCAHAVREVALAIVTYARQLWGSGEQLDQVLLTGGGGPLIQPLARDSFAAFAVAPTPHLANARGYVRYALYGGRHSR